MAAGKTVTFRGAKDPLVDGTTRVVVEVDGKEYRFPKGQAVEVPAKVADRLKQDDLQGLEFEGL
jgi:hypothetical protein